MNSFNELYASVDVETSVLEAALEQVFDHPYFSEEDIKEQCFINSVLHRELHETILKQIITYSSLAMNVMHKHIFEQMTVLFNLHDCLQHRHFAIGCFLYMKEHPEVTLSGTLYYNNLQYYNYRLDKMIDKILLLSAQRY